MSFLSQTHISLVTMCLSGFPILNDPLYNHPAWGEERGAKGQGIKDINTVIHSNTNSIGLTLNNVDDNVLITLLFYKLYTQYLYQLI